MEEELKEPNLVPDNPSLNFADLGEPTVIRIAIKSYIC